MKYYFFKRTLLACGMCLMLVLTSGCIVINVGDYPIQKRFERKIELSEPMLPGASFWADTYNGSITIKGMDVMECTITATIIAHAEDEIDAQRLAEETTVELLPINGGLEVIIDKPQSKRRRSVSVNLDISIPNQVDLDITTKNGEVIISDVMGDVRGKSYNGEIIAEITSGDVQLETYNGDVSCKSISGRAQITSYNGDLEAIYSGDGASPCDISMKTYNGSIDFISPPGFSAIINASTQNGSIKSDLPIKVTGKSKKNKLRGTLGRGRGRLYLASYNGSIKIE